MAKSVSSHKWLKEHKADHYYRRAKKEGYRARSAYKLSQLNGKYRLIKPGMTVIDLGAAPGGWLQMITSLVGEEGLVIGVDLKGIKPIEGVTFIKGDMTSKGTLKRVLEVVGSRELDVVCSDMSPDITGNYTMDQARSVHLCEMALGLARKVLKKDGALVMKIFQGEDFHKFLGTVKQQFRHVVCHTPPASRKASSELYIVAKRFRGKRTVPKAESRAEPVEGPEDDEGEGVAKEQQFEDEK